MQQKLESDQTIMEKNREIIRDEIKKLAVINYETVSELIPKLLAEGKLSFDPSVYTPADAETTDARGIGRYLIYEHTDEVNFFSIWIFSFAPGQKTSIHDHKYKGTVTVLQEPVAEKYYEPEGKLAKLVGRANRYLFHTNRDELDSNFVHQLKRRKLVGEGTSITLHIYKMAAHFINQEGNEMEQRNLERTYLKDKSVDKSSIPSYTDEYYASSSQCNGP